MPQYEQYERRIRLRSQGCLTNWPLASCSFATLLERGQPVRESWGWVEMRGQAVRAPLVAVCRATAHRRFGSFHHQKTKIRSCFVRRDCRQFGLLDQIAARFESNTSGRRPWEKRFALCQWTSIGSLYHSLSLGRIRSRAATHPRPSRRHHRTTARRQRQAKTGAVSS